MSVASAAGLSVALLVIVASPGPGVFATVARAIASGVKPALALICGVVLGDLLYLLFAFYGVAAAARFSGNTFLIVKACGGTYLLWQGIRVWRDEPHADLEGYATAPASRLGNIATGLAVTLSNPMGVAFYCGFLPTFLDLSAPGPDEFLVAAVIVIAVLMSVLGSYAILAYRARALFKTPRAIRLLNRAAGGVMVLVAVVIATRL